VQQQTQCRFWNVSQTESGGIVTGLKLSNVCLGALIAGSFVVSPVCGFAQDEDGDIQFAPENDPAATDDQSDMMYKDEDDQPKSAAPVPAPAEPQAEPQPAAPAQPDATPALDLSSGRRDVLFGSYRVRLSLARPDFEKLRFYDKLYGRESLYPTLAADWYFWDWYATLGVSFRGGFYTAEGKAAKQLGNPVAKFPDDVTDDDIEADENSKTTMTAIPMQVCLTAEITPLRQKWLVVDGYIGYEYLYWQEVRETKSAGTDSTAAMIQSDSTAEASDDSLTNQGSQNGTVLGFSANILLNGLDEASANSMRGALGLGNIYISPFMEYARTLSKAPDFSRTTMGIGFTFESIK
jgi:hypothetical protein